jgi:tRNA pseudouridine55 synthase
VLVLAFGEGTKLVPWLTAEDKEYDATIALVAETDTLDADGVLAAHAPVPAGIDEARVRAALAPLLGRSLQRAPAVSAIKVGGEALHARVRRGEAVEPPEREVVLHEAQVRGVQDGAIQLHVHCGKGFYVRALARDLAAALGTLGHLTALRRTRSGAFGLDGAIGGDVLAQAARGDEPARETVHAAVRSLVQGCAGMALVTLDPDGVTDARHGRPVRSARVIGGTDTLDGLAPGPIAMLTAAGQLVAIAERQRDTLRILRGFLT